MKNIKFNAISTIVGLSSTISSLSVSAQEKPNFVFIAVDDLNVYNTVLGSLPMNFLNKIYPDSTVRADVLKKLTPNMQRFSKMALTFDNTFCASPLSGPSRTALLTGVPTHVSGYYQHDKHFRAYETLTDAVTLPQYLMYNGYFTAGIGKIFHKSTSYLDRGFFSDWPDQLFSWSKWVPTNIGTDNTTGSHEKFTVNISKYWDDNGKKSENYTRFGTTSLPRESSADYQNAKFISDLILKGKASKMDVNGQLQTVVVPKKQPWLLACGLFAPHLPWVVPQEFVDMFPQSEMQINRELLDWVKEDVKDLSPTGKEKTTNTGFSKLINYGLKIDGAEGDLNAWKAALQAYLATVAFSDRNIGVLLDAIEKNKEKNNTYVILWSDNGYQIGDKMWDGKTSMWEASNHVNFMIYNPKIKTLSSGIRNTTPVSLQDFYPTIVSLAGLNRPEKIYGHDLTSLLLNPEKEWDFPVLSTYNEGNHSLRTSKYRFIRFKNGDKELYDMIKDPLEFTNLANDASYNSVLTEMNELLDKTLNKTPKDYQQDDVNNKK